MDKKETLSILYQERNRLNSKYNSPGWNLWATVGAICGLLWGTLILIESNKFVLGEIIPIFLICFASLLILTVFFILIMPNDSTLNLAKNKYFVLKDKLSNYRFYIIFNILIFGLIIYSNLYYQYLNGIYFYILEYYLIALVVIFSIFFIMSFIDLPFPKNVSSSNHPYKKTVIGLFIFCFSCPIILVIKLITVINIHSITFYSSIKFSLILITFYCLILLLYKLLTPKKLLEKVDDLITCLLFDKKTPEEILPELEVITLGLELGLYFEKIFADYFKEIEEIDNHCNNIIISFNEYESKIVGLNEYRENVQKLFKEYDEYYSLVIKKSEDQKDYTGISNKAEKFITSYSKESKNISNVSNLMKETDDFISFKKIEMVNLMIRHANFYKKTSKILDKITPLVGFKDSKSELIKIVQIIRERQNHIKQKNSDLENRTKVFYETIEKIQQEIIESIKSNPTL